jgi:AcrR family transcriptional regulator
MSSKRERTRLTILQAAWDRLSKPDDPARLEDIAADADVTRQSVYLHFGSRTGLLIALVDHMDDVLELNKRIAELRAVTDPVVAFEQTLRLMATYEPRIHGVAMALMRLAPTDPDAAAAFDDRMKLRLRGLTDVLRTVEEQGKLSPDWTARQAAEACWQAGHPSSYELLVVGRGWSVKTYERWLWHVGRSLLAPGT